MLEEATEFLKQQKKKPMEGGTQRAANAMDKDQDESDMKWISGETSTHFLFLLSF